MRPPITIPTIIPVDSSLSRPAGGVGDGSEDEGVCDRELPYSEEVWRKEDGAGVIEKLDALDVVVVVEPSEDAVENIEVLSGDKTVAEAAVVGAAVVTVGGAVVVGSSSVVAVVTGMYMLATGAEPPYTQFVPSGIFGISMSGCVIRTK